MIANPTNHHQLPSSSHHGLAALYDAPLGLSRRATRRVQYYRKIQHCAANTAAGLDIFELADLESMLLLRQRLEHRKMYIDSGGNVFALGWH